MAHRRGAGPRGRDGAKAYEYLALGVAEYLVFDPTGEYMAEQCRGWRWHDRRREPCRADADGRYHSALGVSFSPEEVFLRISGPDGKPVLLDLEVTDLEEQAAIMEERVAFLARENVAQARELTNKERENVAQAQEIAALRAQLEQLRRQDSR